MNHLPRTLVQLILLGVILQLNFLALVTTVAAQGPDVIIDQGPTIQNEISLAIIPGAVAGQPSLLMAAYNDDPVGPTGLGVSTSTDGGTTWSNSQLPIVPGMANAFDPSAAADTLGNVFVAHISDDGSGFGMTGPASGLYVHRYDSITGLWSGPTTVSSDAASMPGMDAAYRFNDRVQITVDDRTGSSFQNNVYAGWIKDRGLNQPTPTSDIYFSASTDQGVSFSAPTLVNDLGASPPRDLGNMPVPVVDAGGTVYMSWMDYNVRTGGTGNIYLDKSTDGGMTWGNDTLVQSVALPPLTLNTANGTVDARAKGAPVLAASPTAAGVLYMTYAADPDVSPTGTNGPDDSDIFFLRSTNGGATWSSPLLVNFDDPTNNDNFLPWMDVKPNGVIDVAWYDRRNDTGPTGDTLFDVYIANSVDGGLSFSAGVKLNDTSFAAPTALGTKWLGEYMALETDAGYAYVAWTSSLTDSRGDIYFDKIPNSAIPEPTGLWIIGLVFMICIGRRQRD